MKVTRPLLGHAVRVLGPLLEFSRPADEVLSQYFRAHRNLGQHDRAFVAEAVFAVLRRKRSLEAVAGSGEPRALLVAALLRVLGLSRRSLEAVFQDEDESVASSVRAARSE